MAKDVSKLAKVSTNLPNKPIDVRQAALNAERYLKSLAINMVVVNIMLEEVELTEDEQFWLITLSYNDSPSDLQRLMLKKIFKVFKIRRDNGEVISMKIREV